MTNSSRIEFSGSPPPQVPDHEMLRLIGRGGYGEVWLARNVAGRLRAIKIIYRRTFEHRRPYEREFEGIKRYEPISRTHQSQVAILHLGRHERDDYYYYIMELADDASGNLAATLEPSNSAEQSADTAKWARYQARTLETELKQRGKLPLAECIDLASSLSTALDHLHKNSLVHRDIKPSNVIFVNGVPKLADIGLVAQKDTTVSFVGTRGYFPPEGPGTAQADIYSLGKVLYEMSTGKDRSEFPALSLHPEDSTQEGQLLEFNEIILKACHGDSGQRYSSIRELLDDLSLLEKGKSVRRKRTRQRWLGVTRRAAAIGTLMFGFVAIGYLGGRKPAPIRNVDPLEMRVENAEFWDAPVFPRKFDFSPAPGPLRIVFGGEKGLSIWDRDTGINQMLRLAVPKNWTFHSSRSIPRWAPDGKHLAFQGFRRMEGSPGVSALFLADPATGAWRQIGPERSTAEQVQDLCWRPDGQGFTFLAQNGRLVTMALTGDQTIWPQVNLPKGWASWCLLGGYSPDGKSLLMCVRPAANPEGRDVWILPHLTGQAVPLVERPGLDAYPTWAPDGQTVYFISSGGQPQDYAWALWRIQVEAGTRLPKGPSERVFGKKGQRLFHARFVGNGEQLAYAVEERDTRIWVAEAGRIDEAAEVVRGRQPVLSPDGQTIYFVGERADQTGIFAIDRGARASPRRITSLAPLSAGAYRPVYDLSPDGTQIAFFAHEEGVPPKFGIFVAPTKGIKATMYAEVLDWGSIAIIPAWSPDGQSLAYTAGNVLHRISRDGTINEALATMVRWEGWSLRWSPDGQHIAALAYEKPEEEQSAVVVVSVAGKHWIRLTPEHEGNFKEGLEWHPDGQRLSYLCQAPEKSEGKMKWVYLDGRPPEEVLDQEKRLEYAGVWAGWRPKWSRDGRTAVWSRWKDLRYFELCENFE